MSTVVNNECSGQTIVDRIKYWGEKTPDTPAFIFWGLSGRFVMSRGEVFDLSSRFAFSLIELGVKPRDVICVSLPNSPQRLVVEYGIQFAGAVAMNGQVLRADGQDITDAIVKAKCTYIILDPEVTDGAWQIIKKVVDIIDSSERYAECKCQAIPHLRKVVFCGAGRKENNFLGSLNNDKKYIHDGGKPNDMATIFATSGSTGYSKLVSHTHETVLTLGSLFSHVLSLQEGNTYLNNSPFGWAGGYPSAFLFSGCTRIAIDESAGKISDIPALLWEIISREEVYAAFLLPMNLARFNDRRRVTCSSKSYHKMQSVMTGGQPITKQICEIAGEVSYSFSYVYCSTECALMCRYHLNTQTEDDFEDNMVGQPLPGISMKVVDKNLDRVPPMSTGEIGQSPALCVGYIGAEISSSKSFLSDGWFRTGDVGFMREDGCLFVEGRRSDAITHGGYILYPSWLEKVLIKCPGVKDVIIVPVPDKVLHHEICACVQPDADAELSADCVINFSQKQILLDKTSSLNVVPRYVVFVPEIPKTTTGKPDRKRLTQMAETQLNL